LLNDVPLENPIVPLNVIESPTPSVVGVTGATIAALPEPRSQVAELPLPETDAPVPGKAVSVAHVPIVAAPANGDIPLTTARYAAIKVKFFVRAMVTSPPEMNERPTSDMLLRTRAADFVNFAA
jgi:hypothetical protein